RRVKEALDDAGVEIPFPRRTVWLRTDDPEGEPQALTR
ncbi:mechanosensitive ion channel family protein, partial [Streptomyces sp. SID6013]|nr:mechanosensitive ion channel family protein [Streptomyces sp. SID6013]